MTLRQITRAPASAVGAGIAAAIFAAAATPEANSPEAWVHFCTIAAEEAYCAALESYRPPIAHQNSAGKMLAILEEMERRKTGEPPPEPELEPYNEEAAINAAHSAAAIAFRSCMPKLTGRRTAQAYIACAAVAMQRGYILAKDAKAMLYTAQLALQAYPSRRAPRARK